ncbi:MAG: 4Fe-4S cluster-binding domain-containing protein [Verrucomicrobiota bacterium]
METGLVFKLQRYSVQDGPGIRMTVFLKGCPLHCAWCHNPEGQSAWPELLVLESRCLACCECRHAREAIALPGGEGGQGTPPGNCEFRVSNVELGGFVAFASRLAETLHPEIARSELRVSNW